MRLKKCMLAIVLGTMVLSVSVPVHAEKKAFAFTTNGTEKRVSPAKKRQQHITHQQKKLQ